MIPYFCFIDSSGVLEKDPNQPFFGIGVLMIEDTSRLHQELALIKSKAIAATKARAKTFEFKFNRITRTSRPFYQDLIDAAFAHKRNRVCVFVLDKTDPKIQPDKYFKSTWDAYLSYTKLVIRRNVPRGRRCIVVADYITKPTNEAKFFESELCTVGQVVNATLLESDASVFIQLIDLFAGAVLFQFKRKAAGVGKVDREKLAVSNHLMKSLNRKTLAESFTVTRPIYFSVWRFSPK